MKTPFFLLAFFLMFLVPISVQLAAEYAVGPGDVLDITVYESDDLKTKVRVGDDGSIVMPLIGQVFVDSMTVTQIGDKITEMLADGYLVNPKVNVFVEEFRSRKVVILGRVESPGLIELSGAISLLELISKAGGLAEDAGDTATIKRRNAISNEFIEIDLESLIEGGDLTQNVAILDGDTVVISKSGMCYVTGEVNTPGSYPCGEDTTVLQLIALAGGFNGKASKSSVRIVRFIESKKTVLKNVDLDTTFVKDEDVIVVPESFF